MFHKKYFSNFFNFFNHAHLSSLYHSVGLLLCFATLPAQAFEPDVVCQSVYEAVQEGKLAEVKVFSQTVEPKRRETCLRQATKQMQAYGDEQQFKAFQYVLNQLIAMELPDQQALLDELLHNYAVIYLAYEPRFTQYLLRMGASPEAQIGQEENPFYEALWSVQDWGSCQTARHLINAVSPNGLARVDQQGNTPLMSVMTLAHVCDNEVLLMARKSAELDQQGKAGNTALHILLQKMNQQAKDGHVYEVNKTVLKVLVNRGVSLDIPNDSGITARTLLKQVREAGCGC